MTNQTLKFLGCSPKGDAETELISIPEMQACISSIQPIRL